jgi:predicted Zn finger-like uncharacterized protein
VSENDRPTQEVGPEPAMTVHCPHCSTGYLLPSHLIGPRGARVRCPSCHGSFVVLPDGEWEGSDEALGASRVAESSVLGVVAGPAVAAETMAPSAVIDTAPSGEPARPETPGEEAADVAAAIMKSLAHHLGESLVEARRSGRVLSRHGPAIVDAFAEYRRRAGPGVSAEPFQAALKACSGVDLMPRRDEPA